MTIKRQAIIDIGSNAIRVAVYDSEKIGASVIYQDKFRTNFVEIINSTNYDTHHSFYNIIQYCLNIFKKFNVIQYKCVATASFRSGNNYAQFVQFLNQKYNFVIDVLSGEDEARLTAAGVILCFEKTSGIIADLGAGSLELIRVCDNNITGLISLELGSRALKSLRGVPIENIDQHTIDTFNIGNIENVYLVGGGFRYLGKNYANNTRYPLKNLHALEISDVNLMRYINKVQQEKSDSKILTDHHAIKIVTALSQNFRPQKFIISNYGLQEGARLEILSHKEKNKDIILERCRRITYFNDAMTPHIDIYVNFIIPYTINSDIDIKKLIAIAMMFVASNVLDMPTKSMRLPQMILTMDIPLTHRQRLMLSTIVCIAFQGDISTYLANIIKVVLPKDDYDNATIIGQLFYIINKIDGYGYCGGPSFQIKDHKQLEIEVRSNLPYGVWRDVQTALQSIEKLCPR